VGTRRCVGGTTAHAERWLLQRAITSNASTASYPIARLQQAEVSSFLSKRDECFWGQTDVFGDLPNEDWRDVPPAVIRNSRTATIRMSKLFMRTALSHFHKS